MNIVSAAWLPYCLPLKRPWQSSQGSLTERHGRLLRLRAADGRTGWGDCAPLPEFGIDKAAATAFAEESALLDLAAQRASLPLDAWLSGTSATASIAVNASLGAVAEIADGALNEALAAGYRVLKLKVGCAPWSSEIGRLQELSAILPPGAGFRLDANAAWKMADAAGFIRACRDLPIESLEEPLEAPTAHGLLKLQELVDFPLAIDESRHLLTTDFFQQPPVRRLIIKPARHGGLLGSVVLGLEARAAGIDCIVTSSLESSCGLLACAHLAATIAPKATHGLATADWLGKDTGQPLPIKQGRLRMPGTEGLGFVAMLADSATSTYWPPADGKGDCGSICCAMASGCKTNK